VVPEIRTVTDAPQIWKVPRPYGYPDAVTTAGTIAAPLLAGFAITLTVLVIQNGPRMLAPGLALILLSATVVALVAAVQFAFVARLYQVTPSEMLAWWPDSDDPARMAQLVKEQQQHRDKHRRWSAVFRRTYNLGVLLFLASVAVMLMPPSHSHHQTERWIACAVLAVGFFGELGWVIGTWAEQLGPAWYS
jgi:MFS family permease